MSEGHPERIGPYRLLQVLGQGGMGLVYVAEQSEPVRRRVALKIIKMGMDTREVVARFQAERQALAVMEHPNIAKVLDGGATEDGRPYFVMELVKGLPITDYCDQHKLDTRDRLRLFIPVCHAVQHAHQKGVIHRDLKPSNILVMLQDGEPMAKVIDFGIAKALSQPLTERTLVTEVGKAIGTAAYMSPEQAAPTALDVDTRTDVYSLGVTLYELLVGRLPLDPSEMGPAAFMYKLANQETNPSTPSMKLATMGEAAGPVSAVRRTDIRGLRRELKGDLDWIAMKALDPDRTRRYDTVNALADDLERFLRSEPVLARPPSTGYRVSRFVRRNRPAVIAAALVTVSLIAGLAGTALSLVRARRAEALARQEAETARQVSEFVTGLFKVSDPGEARGNSVTAREILDRGAQRIRTELAAQPEVQARLMGTIGGVYSELGLYGQAQALLEEALRSQRDRLGDDAPEAQATMFALARLAQSQGRFAVAESLYRATIASAERAHGPAAPQLAPLLNGLGGLFITRQRFAAGESLLVRAVQLRTRAGGREDVDFARMHRNLGAAYLAQGRYAQAEPELRTALDMYERVAGADHPDIARTLSNLGVVYYQLGRLDEAERYYRRAEPALIKSLGPDHPHVSALQINLGEIAWKKRDFREAEQRLRRALEIQARTLDSLHPSIAIAELDLANILRDAGRGAEADRHYQRALRVREAALGTDAPAVAEVLGDYATFLRSQGRGAQAGPLEARAAAIRTARPSPSPTP